MVTSSNSRESAHSRQQAPGVGGGTPEASSRPGRRYCGARKRQTEGTCRRPAGWGTPHPGWGNCKLHLGSTRRRCTAADWAEARAQLAAVKDELTRQYRATHQPPPPTPADEPWWLTTEGWATVLEADRSERGHDSASVERV